MRKLIVGALTIVALAALPKPADAAIISGTLDIAGAVRITAEANGSTTIDWQNPVDVQGTSTGSFLGIGGTDTMIDLNSAVFPTSGFPPLNQFQTLSARPTFDFVLQDIQSCAELGPFVTCAAGATSAFGFAQVGTGASASTTVTLLMTGIVFDTLTPTLISTWVGTFTAQFSGQTIAGLLADFAANGFIDTSFSASKVTVFSPVPEPTIMALFGTALIAGGLRARRRRHSA
jgi:hypothetical protein